MKFLFVCSSNIDRSPCAKELFKDNKEHEAKSCGILPHAKTYVTKARLNWADIVFCMEHEHKQFIFENFPEFIDKVRVLNVPNTYSRNDPELKKVLMGKLNDFLKNPKCSQ